MAAVYRVIAGERLRIHDCTFGAGKLTRCATTPHPRATHRVFVSEDLTRRLHVFGRGESRELVPDQLERQLAGAGYLGERFDPSSRDPF